MHGLPRFWALALTFVLVATPAFAQPDEPKDPGPAGSTAPADPAAKPAPADTAPKTDTKAPAKDAAVTDPAAKDPAAGDPAAKDPAAKDPATYPDKDLGNTPQDGLFDKPKDKKKHDDTMASPSLGGLSGLIRTVTSDIGPLHSFSVSLYLELFTANDFISIGDKNSRFIGTLAASYTPWEYVELFVNIRSQANSNERTDANRLDQEVILALGDISFGGKFQYPIHPSIAVGANIEVGFLNSVGGVSVDGGSTGFYGGILASFKAMELWHNVPLRAHLNFGARLDNSSKLVNFGPAYTNSNRTGLPSLTTEKFGLGINRSRLQLKVGIDAPLKRWTSIGVTPMVEFSLDSALGDGDPDFIGLVPAGDYTGRIMTSLALGVRVNPIGGLNVTLGTDIGLTSPGFGFGPPVVPWNVMIGLSYSYDPKPQVKVVTKETIKHVGPDTSKQGRIRGRVVDAKTMEPVEAAVIVFPGKDLTGLASDPDGGFVSYHFDPGSMIILVRHADYEPAKVEATIVAGQPTKLEVKLTPKPRVGHATGKVTDAKGNAVMAQLRFRGAQQRDARTGPDGTFDVALKAGSYTLEVQADGFPVVKRTLALTNGATQTLTIQLAPKVIPKDVKITRRSLRLRRQVHFSPGTAAIKADSEQLLDQVAAVLQAHPEITLVQVQGHTDNTGTARGNKRLSQKRAEAVVNYLIGKRISGSRLQARGYGQSRPRRPNITARNRALNRRVEFRIRKRAK